jgi:DUF4097 and DUF4098 domain-containing protein YvlB
MLITDSIQAINFSHIKIDSIASSIKIEATTDENITLVYSSTPSLSVQHNITEEILTIHIKTKAIRSYGPFDNSIKIFIPENIIHQLDIESSTAYIHIIGKEKLFRSCHIEVDAGALYLEEIYGDLSVKTVTGAIRLKNATVLSNITLETMIGVIDANFTLLSKDVAITTSGIVQRNMHYRKAHNPRYQVTARSSVGVINIH